MIELLRLKWKTDDAIDLMIIRLVRSAYCILNRNHLLNILRALIVCFCCKWTSILQHQTSFSFYLSIYSCFGWFFLLWVGKWFPNAIQRGAKQFVMGRLNVNKADKCCQLHTWLLHIIIIIILMMMIITERIKYCFVYLQTLLIRRCIVFSLSLFLCWNLRFDFIEIIRSH